MKKMRNITRLLLCSLFLVSCNDYSLGINNYTNKIFVYKDTKIVSKLLLDDKAFYFKVSSLDMFQEEVGYLTYTYPYTYEDYEVKTNYIGVSLKSSWGKPYISVEWGKETRNHYYTK